MRVNGVNRSPIFIPPGENTKTGPTPKQLETNPPKEWIGWSKVPTLKDIPPKTDHTTSKLQNIESEKWLNDLFKNLTLANFKEKLHDIMSLGYTKEEAKQILKRAVEITERSADWSVNALSNCGNGARFILFAFPFAVGKAFLKNLEIGGELFKKSLGFFDGLFTGIRNYLQNMIYGGRPDDDGSRNRYEGVQYGNKISALWADIAFHTETKVNPWAFPILGILSDKIQQIIKPILFSQNPMWFRVRMGSDISLRFATDLFSLLIHKPLSLLGFKKSIDIVDEIKSNGCLNGKYIAKRHIENADLDPQKDKVGDIPKQVFKLTGNVFSGNTDLKTKKRSSDKLAKLFGPFLGLWGFTALLVSTPLRAILKCFNKESKYLNSLFQSGFASQHLEYILKFVLPEQYENKLMESKTNQEVKKLKQEKNNLYYSGMVTFLSNIVSTGVKLIKIENKYLRFARDIFDEITDKGVAYYFSRRRELIARKHKVFNNELYNPDGSVKIISDKLEQFEKEETQSPLEPETNTKKDIIPPVLN